MAADTLIAAPALPAVGGDAAPFIQATEVWTPDETGERLVLSSGIYGALDDFARISAGHGFARGEGLPGKAWAEARPVVLKGFEGSFFQRADAAREAGLTAAVAIPVFDGETLKAVLVFLCGDDDERIGAIEIWEAESKDAGELKLHDGYYGAARHFEWVSQHTHFPRGSGLPGSVWAARTPILMRDLGAGYAFVRAESAGKAGLTTGLGLPVPTPGEAERVLTLLSARGAPIARRFEIWSVVRGKTGPDAEAQLIDGLCSVEGPLWPAEGEAPRRAKAWAGPLGKVLGAGVPFAAEGADAPGLPAGHGAVVALPIHPQGGCAHVVAWYF